MFQLPSADTFEALLQETLDCARQAGATAAEVSSSIDHGFSTVVRSGTIDVAAYHQSQELAVVVFFEQRKGTAVTTDFSPEAIRACVQSACDIAKFTESDPYAGLAPPERMAKTPLALDLQHPWHITPDQAIDIASNCESLARAHDVRLVNSEGAEVSTTQSLNGYGNSHGFIGIIPSSLHSISCSLIAEANGSMQRDYDYTLARSPEDLQSVSAVAKRAAQRTVQRLGARSISTARVPVLFEAPLACGLIRTFVSAISGGALYRKASFLLDHLGQQVFPEFMEIDERPHQPKGLASTYFDGDGVATEAQCFVEAGVLTRYALSAYAGRRLGMASTGNAGGVHNLRVKPNAPGFEALVKTMDRGVVVTELMGQGINLTTGDYSRGASGFWVEGGEIQYPVEGITIAGFLPEMFRQIIAVGNDTDPRYATQCGSILIESMTVAGD